MQVRNLSKIWKINGKPIYEPDRSVGRQREHIATAESGRSDDGVNHIEFVRVGIRKVEIKYSALTEKQLAYMLDLLYEHPADMTLTYPDPQSGITTIHCYPGGDGDDLYSYLLYGGLCRNFHVNLIEL